MTTEQQGLERRTAAPIVITTPEQYSTALEGWHEHYNVLTPFTSMIGVAPSHGLIASVVKLDTDPAKGEVYSGFTESGAKAMPFLKGDRGKPNEELAPAKIGLRKLAECGAISTDAIRTDNGGIRNYWAFKATASYRGLDGSRITRSANFEWDLRDGSDRTKGWQPNQVTEGRKNGLRNCEARAINAAIRECGCGIKQKYTRAELDKPFLVVRVAFLPDMDDPDIKRMVTAQALGGIDALYPPARALPAGDVVDANPQPGPRQVGSSSTASASGPAKPDPNLPPTPDAVKIATADQREFVYKNGAKTGQKGIRFVIVDSTGQAITTFSKTHYDDAVRFKAEHAWVEIATETQGGYVNIIEITKAGQQPSLPDLGNV